ncbi:hypothetical protein HU200_044791 [Digitaria exilis]|uniref:DNA topoisomerase (ATP-hydrolyzing) n=1 Tax=Digitaria exilis TaxID=1010633 RepID=A0A835AYY3_9POAL|nr:hypothetical protein HU200_044791 [Digitaria exilis]
MTTASSELCLADWLSLHVSTASTCFAPAATATCDIRHTLHLPAHAPRRRSPFRHRTTVAVGRFRHHSPFKPHRGSARRLTLLRRHLLILRFQLPPPRSPIPQFPQQTLAHTMSHTKINLESSSAHFSAAVGGGITPRERMLLLPQDYIGSVEKCTRKIWVLEGVSMAHRMVTYVPGLLNIFDEMLVYAADNKQRDPEMDSLRVEVDAAECRISIYYNGHGVPIELHPEEGVYMPEMIFGNLSSCEEIAGGRNSYGVKLTNLFSTEFVIETVDCRLEKKYKQVTYFSSRSHGPFRDTLLPSPERPPPIRASDSDATSPSLTPSPLASDATRQSESPPSTKPSTTGPRCRPPRRRRPRCRPLAKALAAAAATPRSQASDLADGIPICRRDSSPPPSVSAAGVRLLCPPQSHHPSWLNSCSDSYPANSQTVPKNWNRFTSRLNSTPPSLGRCAGSHPRHLKRYGRIAREAELNLSLPARTNDLTHSPIGEEEA